MAPPAAATARWQQQRDCGSGGSGGGNCRMATEVMAAVTQWRRQAHNITIKYAAADNDGNGDGNNYNDDDEDSSSSDGSCAAIVLRQWWRGRK